MIRTFKVFENVFTKPNFKAGDIVICIGSKKGVLTYGERYEITNIYRNGFGEWFCNVKGSKSQFYCYRFIPEFEYNANKYNL